MNTPRMTVRYIFGKIGVEKIPGYFKLVKGNANIKLKYNKEEPFKIDNPPSRIEIDQTKPLEDINFRKFLSFVKFMEGRAKREYSKVLKEMVDEGDRLAKIELKGNAIAELARKELDEENKEPVLVSIPSSTPQVKVKGGEVEVKGGRTRIEVKSDYYTPGVEYRPDRIDIYLIQKGELKIEFSGDNVDYRV